MFLCNFVTLKLCHSSFLSNKNPASGGCQRRDKDQGRTSFFLRLGDGCPFCIKSSAEAGFSKGSGIPPRPIPQPRGHFFLYYFLFFFNSYEESRKPALLYGNGKLCRLSKTSPGTAGIACTKRDGVLFVSQTLKGSWAQNMEPPTNESCQERQKDHKPGSPDSCSFCLSETVFDVLLVKELT